MDERRAHPRYAAVELKAVAIDGDEESDVTARDVSQEGICLVTSKRYDCGSQIRVRLWLDFGQQRLSENFEAIFRVVWCTPVEEVFQIGAALADTNPEIRKLMATLVHYIARDVSQEGGELRFLTRH